MTNVSSLYFSIMVSTSLMNCLLTSFILPKYTRNCPSLYGSRGGGDSLRLIEHILKAYFVYVTSNQIKFVTTWKTNWNFTCPTQIQVIIKKIFILFFFKYWKKSEEQVFVLLDRCSWHLYWMVNVEYLINLFMGIFHGTFSAILMHRLRIRLHSLNLQLPISLHKRKQ